MPAVWKPLIDFPTWRRVVTAVLVILSLSFPGYARAATVFLPLITRQQPLQNGDFETVPNVSWTEENSYLYPLILDGAALLEGITPQGGSRSVWLVGDNDETSILTQTFFVPTDAAFLVYHYWIRSDEPPDYCGVDQAQVRLGVTTLATFDLCETTNTGGWVEGRIDLAGYRGRIVELVFGAVTDSMVYSDFFLDTVYISTLIVD